MQGVLRCHEAVNMKGVTFSLSQVIQGRNDGISDRVHSRAAEAHVSTFVRLGCVAGGSNKEALVRACI